MLNLNTKWIINPRDVVCMKKSYKAWSKIQITSSKQEDDNNEDFFDRVETLNLEEKNIKTQDVKDRVYRKVKGLERSFNSEASKIIESIDQGK
jgi:hypothetical protein